MSRTIIRNIRVYNDQIGVTVLSAVTGEYEAQENVQKIRILPPYAPELGGPREQTTYTLVFDTRRSLIKLPAMTYAGYSERTRTYQFVSTTGS